MASGPLVAVTSRGLTGIGHVYLSIESRTLSICTHGRECESTSSLRFRTSEEKDRDGLLAHDERTRAQYAFFLKCRSYATARVLDLSRTFETQRRRMDPLGAKCGASYRVPKLQRNAERDLVTTARIEALGWAVLRFWETRGSWHHRGDHRDDAESADRVATATPRRQLLVDVRASQDPAPRARSLLGTRRQTSRRDREEPTRDLEH